MVVIVGLLRKQKRRVQETELHGLNLKRGSAVVVGSCRDQRKKLPEAALGSATRPGGERGPLQLPHIRPAPRRMLDKPLAVLPSASAPGRLLKP